MVNTVDPEKINDWMDDNREIIHRNSLNKCKEFIDLKLEDEVIHLMDFEWNNDVYAKVYIHTEVMNDALESAKEFFVENEMFEEASLARDLLVIVSNK
jgi:hypothetical protein